MFNNFLPATDADRVAWLNHFSDRLVEYGPQFDIDADRIQDMVDSALAYSITIARQNAARQYWIAMSNSKKLLAHTSQQTPMSMPAPMNLGDDPPLVNNGIFDRVAAIVTSIRQHPAYTAAIGQDMGIVPPAVVPVNPATLQPNLSVKLEAGYPHLRWTKGDTDGVNIYVDRHDGNGFVLLKHTTKGEYIDPTPLPANTYSVTWEYKIRYLFGDDEVGQFSTVISVNVVRA